METVMYDVDPDTCLVEQIPNTVADVRFDDDDEGDDDDEINDNLILDPKTIPKKNIIRYNGDASESDEREDGTEDIPAKKGGTYISIFIPGITAFSSFTAVGQIWFLTTFTLSWQFVVHCITLYLLATIFCFHFSNQR